MLTLSKLLATIDIDTLIQVKNDLETYQAQLSPDETIELDKIRATIIHACQIMFDKTNDEAPENSQDIPA